MQPRDFSRDLRAKRNAIAAVVILALLAAGCSKSADSGGAGAPPPATAPAPNRVGGLVAGPADSPTTTDGGRVEFGIEAEPEGLDPTRYAFSSSGHTVASAVFDPLTTLDANGNGIPYLATAIDGSDQYKTWTITLPST